MFQVSIRRPFWIPSSPTTTKLKTWTSTGTERVDLLQYHKCKFLSKEKRSFVYSNVFLASKCSFIHLPQGSTYILPARLYARATNPIKIKAQTFKIIGNKELNIYQPLIRYQQLNKSLYLNNLLNILSSCKIHFALILLEVLTVLNPI